MSGIPPPSPSALPVLAPLKPPKKKSKKGPTPASQQPVVPAPVAVPEGGVPGWAAMDVPRVTPRYFPRMPVFEQGKAELWCTPPRGEDDFISPHQLAKRLKTKN
jgi:hypothetical protein